MQIAKYSLGTGDRFGLQGKAQLAAIEKARRRGVELSIVWNKSHREHCIVGSSPQDVRNEADKAVKDLNYQGQYFVDADHIGIDNVDLFMDSSDFFTLDVADFIGRKSDKKSLTAFLEKQSSGPAHIASLLRPSRSMQRSITEKSYCSFSVSICDQSTGMVTKPIFSMSLLRYSVFVTMSGSIQQPRLWRPRLLFLHLAARTISPCFSASFSEKTSAFFRDSSASIEALALSLMS